MQLSLFFIKVRSEVAFKALPIGAHFTYPFGNIVYTKVGKDLARIGSRIFTVRKPLVLPYEGGAK